LPANRKRGAAAPQAPAGRKRGVVTPKAIAHLRGADPVIGALIDEIGVDGLGDRRRGRPDDRYGTLVRSIVGQQLSTIAARAIYTRLTDRYRGRPPTPAEVLADDPDELRVAAGLSHAKVKYLRSLAEHVVDGSLELDRLDKLPNEEVRAELVAVNGIGPWSADLFLMFQLERPDVLPVGDLGIRRAIMVRYGLATMPVPAEALRIGEPWRPYRTLASLFLWRSLHNAPL
jgi:DNA-3-methyladenine glycosylase II